MRRAALAGGLLVLAVGFALFVLPFLMRDRTVLTTTPQPPPLRELALVNVPAGMQTCMDDVVIDEHSERALIKVGTNGRPPSPLRFTLTGPGLRQVRRIAPTYADSARISVPVDPPARAVAATVCVRNDGRRMVALYAAEKNTRSTTRVEGKQVPVNLELLFAEAEPQSLLDQLPLSIERMQAFRPGAAWFAWLIAVLFVIGVPLTVVWAFAAGAHADEERDRKRTAPATLDGR